MRPKSEMYSTKRDDEHLRSFPMGDPPIKFKWLFADSSLLHLVQVREIFSLHDLPRFYFIVVPIILQRRRYLVRFQVQSCSFLHLTHEKERLEGFPYIMHQLQYWYYWYKNHLNDDEQKHKGPGEVHFSTISAKLHGGRK